MSISENAQVQSAKTADTERFPRYAQFAASRIGRWRRQQWTIFVIEALFVGAALFILLR